jgi:hypothetical protein
MRERAKQTQITVRESNINKQNKLIDELNKKLLELDSRFNLIKKAPTTSTKRRILISYLVGFLKELSVVYYESFIFMLLYYLEPCFFCNSCI